MTPVRTGLLVLMLLVFSSEGVAHDHLAIDLERDSSCLICSFTDAAPLSASSSPLPLWSDSAGATAWPHALVLAPRDCLKGYLGRGPPVSR